MRARAARSRLHSVRTNETYDPPITRRTVADEYGAGPPEVARGSDRGVPAGRKRDFSPLVDTKAHTPRGAAHESQETRESVCVCARCECARGAPGAARPGARGASRRVTFPVSIPILFFFCFLHSLRTIV